MKEVQVFRAHEQEVNSKLLAVPLILDLGAEAASILTFVPPLPPDFQASPGIPCMMTCLQAAGARVTSTIGKLGTAFPVDTSGIMAFLEALPSQQTHLLTPNSSFWDVLTCTPISVEGNLGGLKKAHDGNIWDMDWHPLGHVLATGSNDYSAKVGVIGPAGFRTGLAHSLVFLTPRPMSHIPLISTVLDAAKAGRSHGR
jgi:hypothetical protein